MTAMNNRLRNDLFTDTLVFQLIDVSPINAQYIMWFTTTFCEGTTEFNAFGLVTISNINSVCAWNVAMGCGKDKPRPICTTVLPFP